MKQQHILSIGETLIDMISDAQQASLLESRTFQMYPGGQVTNVALNIARLGGSAALVARVGDDSFGHFLRHHLVASGVETNYLVTTPHLPTTLVTVSRHTSTPDFIVYRGADAYLLPQDIPLALLASTAVVHTSAFALSREPSRSTILQYIIQAHTNGCLISFDPNYHPSLWEDPAEHTAVFAKICPYITLIKPSLDDCERLFGPGLTPEAYAARFLALGARHVVLTMGSAGALLADAQGTSFYPADQVDVVDVTGAGDSFWAGLLLGMLDGYALCDAVRVGLAVAAIKIQQVGPLSQTIDRQALYKQLGLAR